MSIKASEISDLIKARIDKFQSATEDRNVGTVVSVTDGIVRVHGLGDARYGEMLQFSADTFGLALNLEQDSVGAVVLGDYKNIVEGDTVKTTGRILEVPVGPEMLGRVVDALGNPHRRQGTDHRHGKGAAGTRRSGRHFSQERVSAGTDRAQGHRLHGAGGTRTARTHHRRPPDRQDRRGHRHHHQPEDHRREMHLRRHRSEAKLHRQCRAQTRGARRAGAHHHRRGIRLHAGCHAIPGALCGCAMGEYFMDNGEDALIVYDDLSKQAVAYRQISLLLRRPPGREAYPGDVFYLHSRLLERSARVNEEYVEKATHGRVKGKTGSLTGLPIIETQAGDVTAFVPTNVISITDGQIFLESDLFNAGIRPAINAGISVSRVGGAAQTNIIKKLGGGIRLSLAQYRELAAFSQFASDLDEATRRQLERGIRVTELMKQKQYAPMSVAEMALSLYAANGGFFDKVDRTKVVATEAALQSFARTNYGPLLKTITDKPDLSKDVEASLKKCCEEFFATV